MLRHRFSELGWYLFVCFLLISGGAVTLPGDLGPYPIFHFFPCPCIMNIIIIVCSMKFLLHFPLLMFILFKVYQLENILYNLNGNDSNKCVWGKKSQYCELLLLFYLQKCLPALHSGARHCMKGTIRQPFTPVNMAAPMWERSLATCLTGLSVLIS